MKSSKNTSLKIQLSEESLSVSDKLSFWQRLHLQLKKEQRKKTLDLLEQVELILNDGKIDNGKVVDICEKYISLHRIVENTRARRRLEKWVTRLICWYLIVVLVLLLLTSISIPCCDLFRFSMDETVIIALLTTTTVNIVALGIILVRGLFHERETKDLAEEKA